MTTHRIKTYTTKNARSLRSDMTHVERILWQGLRGGQLGGYKFRRQHPIGKYIADFACIEGRLVIELDGGQHQAQQSHDEQRSAFMQSQGWQVMRFWNNEVMDNLDGVLFKITEKFTSVRLKTIP